MQVKTSVHESVLDQIRPDLRALIRVDAFPDRVYQGTVKSVAVLPDQGGWFSPDTKVYKTIVTIDEEVEQLKPGMTAVVEIDVDRLTDVLTLPIQAIVQVAKHTYCFVDVAGTPERRTVTLGRTNDKFIQVTEGLNEGDRVVLNPMAIVDETEEGDADEQEQEEQNRGADAFEDPRPKERPKPQTEPGPTAKSRKKSPEPNSKRASGTGGTAA